MFVNSHDDSYSSSNLLQKYYAPEILNLEDMIMFLPTVILQHSAQNVTTDLKQRHDIRLSKKSF